MRISTIATARASVDVAAALGGSITRFVARGARGEIDVMRPAGGAALESGDPRGLACFPLVPYSGRVREGRFRFGGGEVAEPLNFAPERHTIHGHGWQRSWRIVDSTATSLAIEYAHAGGHWPWPYRAAQRFSLADAPAPDVHAALSLEIELENRADAPMPGGLGLHPYFVRTPLARVRAGVGGIWETDEEVMPVARAPLPSHALLPGGVEVDTVSLDNAFTGFDGTAHIEWPEHGLGLRITASPPLGHLVVFSPPGEDYFCVEPVTNCTDAFNLAAAGREDTGMIVLAASERVTVRVDFEVMVS